MFVFTLVMTALHTGTPVPHWLVVLTVVPALWAVIGIGVVLIERLLQATE